MSNIQKNDAMPKSVSEVQELAKIFCDSGFFQDSKQMAQGFVKIQAGREMGITPFQAMNSIHIISGKAVAGAGIIASLIKASGKYNYKVKKLDNTICIVDFFESAELIGTETFTIEDAKKAGTKNTDKYPKNMLFARAISNGAKFYTPDIFGGAIYTEGEIIPENDIDANDSEEEFTPATVVDAKNEEVKIKRQPYSKDVSLEVGGYKLSDFNMQALESYSKHPALIEKRASLEGLLKRCTSEEGTMAVLEGCKVIVEEYTKNNEPPF